MKFGFWVVIFWVFSNLSFSQQLDSLRNNNSKPRSRDYLDEYYQNRKSKSLPASKNRISWYPFAFFHSGFKMGFERAYRPNKTIAVNACFSSTEKSNYYSSSGVSAFGRDREQIDIHNFKELYVELQPRFYVSSEAGQTQSTCIPGSFYLSPFVLTRIAKFSAITRQIDPITGIEFMQESDYKAMAVAAGIILGYNAIIEKHFSIDIYFGGGISNANSDGKKLSYPIFPVNSYRNGVTLQPGVSFGMLF